MTTDKSEIVNLRLEVERLRERDAVTQELWERAEVEVKRLQEVVKSKIEGKKLLRAEVERLRGNLQATQEELELQVSEQERLRRIEEAAYRLRNWWEKDGWPRYGPMNDREFVGAVRQPILTVFAALADR